MRARLLPAVLLTTTLSINFFSNAQQADRFAYAVTDNQQNGTGWNYLRKLDLQTGQYSDILLNGLDVNIIANDASTRKPMSAPMNDSRYGTYVNAAFATGVAAVAYDKKSNRLYYTPMLFDQLRYIDLKTMNVYYVNDKIFTGKPQKSSDQGDIVTRMVIASDGNGYAMTNDGTQLIRFTTGKKLEITDLGTLVDDPANKNVSIHNSCSSFGGDMIADDNGNLYVFSARNHVFKVNIESKVATFLGIINGLPDGYTVNGAVVNDNNEILVASAVQSSGWFTLNLKDLTASRFNLPNGAWQSSDLGNGNLLATRPNTAAPDITSRNYVPVAPGESKIAVYPNPVVNNKFTLQFNAMTPGNYTIQVTDVMGRQVVQQAVSVNADGQTQEVRLASSNSRGVYLVKVVDAASHPVFNSKVVVQ